MRLTLLGCLLSASAVGAAVPSAAPQSIRRDYGHLITYPELYRRVQNGERLSLAVGPYQLRFDPINGFNADCAVESLPGVPPGVYDCECVGGTNRMVPRPEPPPEPRVDMKRLISTNRETQ